MALRKTHRLELRKNDAGREVRSMAFEIKTINEDGTIEGYGSVFNTVDSYGDIVKPGAFLDSLAEHKKAGTMPAMLWQHDSDEPLGVWLEMREDAKGLFVKGQILTDTTCGADAYKLLKAGAIKGLSIGFIAVDRSFEGDNRILTKCDLWEVSLVTFPANTKATVTSVKSMGELTVRSAEKALRDAGFSRSEATAFVSGIMKLGEKQRDAAQSTAKALAACERVLKQINPA